MYLGQCVAAALQAGLAPACTAYLHFTLGAACARLFWLTPCTTTHSLCRSKAVSSIFAHASPQNKQATGPVQSYAAMLGSSRYAPLTDWEAAETVRRLQPSETSYMEVVRVTPRGGGAPLMYMWIVSRQGEGSIWHGCWMVDAVQFLGDKLPAQVQPWTSAS